MVTVGLLVPVAAHYRLPPRGPLQVRAFASTTGITPGFSYAGFLAAGQRNSQSQLRGGRKDGTGEEQPATAGKDGTPFNWLLREHPREIEADASTM